MTTVTDNYLDEAYPDTGFNLAPDFSSNVKYAEKAFNKAKIEKFSGVKYISNEFNLKGSKYLASMSIVLDKVFIQLTKTEVDSSSHNEVTKKDLIIFDINANTFVTANLDTNYWKRTLANAATVATGKDSKYVFNKEGAIDNLNKLLLKAESEESDNDSTVELINFIITNIATINDIKSYNHLLVQAITHNTAFSPTKYLYDELKSAAREYNNTIQVATLAVIGIQKVLKENNLLDGLNAGIH